MNSEISGHYNFDSCLIEPKVVILKYSDEIATLVYDDDDGAKQVRKRSFNSLFNQLNTNVLNSYSDMILPNGCIYRGVRTNGEEAYLIQVHPGVRAFRLSSTEAVYKLVGKMQSKFNAQTRVLELNSVEAEEQEKIQKQIAMRNKYIEQQKLKSFGQYMYKLFFRVYFPYTYILIVIKRNDSGLKFHSMSSAVTLNPIQSLNDYVYQFPLSNVGGNGVVCTGNLHLGEYGIIDLKSYIEKMTGYFWNNRFNADITTGPEMYGDQNFLGNWFEWEYISYVNPAAILDLKFNSNITEKKLSVAQYIYDDSYRPSTSKGKKMFIESIYLVNQNNVLKGFETETHFSGSAQVELENGTAKKNITEICDSIVISDGIEVGVGSILKHNKKRFKLLSFDGYKSFRIDGNTLIEDDIMVTHVKIIDEKKRRFRFPLTEKTTQFILDAFRKAKNYEKEAIFPGVTFKSGELIAIFLDSNREAKPDLDIIQSIRNNGDSYLIEFCKRDNNINFKKDITPLSMSKVEILFTSGEIEPASSSSSSSTSMLKDGEAFTYRTNRRLNNNSGPWPFTIKTYLGEKIDATIRVVDIAYKENPTPRYGGGYKSKPQHFIMLNFQIRKEGYNSADSYSSNDLTACVIKVNKNDCKVLVSLPEYIDRSCDGFTEIIPELNPGEVVTMGEHVYTGCPLPYGRDNKLVAPFKIIKDENGKVTIAAFTDQNPNTLKGCLLLPTDEHIKTCLVDVDGVKTFKIRDLFECNSEKEYITFKVGDKVMLTSDWNPQSKEAPSIKTIHDFIILTDRAGSIQIPSQVGSDILGGIDRSNSTEQYKMYMNAHTEFSAAQRERPNDYGPTFKRAVLFAVVHDPKCDNLIFQPMISSTGVHFINGIAHAKEEVGNLKVGDYIKANVGKIPYFTKSTVDQIVGTVEVNNRNLTILKNGMTMWSDIIESDFKIFKKDKLSATKIEYYDGKTREEFMCDFMVLYGDRIQYQVNVPIFTKNTPQLTVAWEDSEYYRHNLFEIYSSTQTLDHITLEAFNALKVENGDHCFETYFGKIINSTAMIKPIAESRSFKMQYDDNRVIGGDFTSIQQPASVVCGFKMYDVCYAQTNRSLTNGSAYMTLDKCLSGPLSGYSYWSSPFRAISSDKAYKRENITASLLSFPTPRVLKKDTNKSKSFKCFEFIGPQNIFYNSLSSDKLRKGKYNNEVCHCIVSDDIFPKIETEPVELFRDLSILF